MGKGNLKQGGPTSNSKKASTTQRSNPNAARPSHMSNTKINSPNSGKMTNGGKC